MSDWRQVACPVPFCKAFVWGDTSLFVGQEPTGKNGNRLWRMSIANRYRYPTWEEIKNARYKFVPDEVTMAMLLPPKSEYVNIHENCFHLHEIEGERSL